MKNSVLRDSLLNELHGNLTPEQKTAVMEELERVLSSSSFEAKDRLHDFLRYVVNETLEGRSSLIRGKTIAADAFHREHGVGDPENLVRANARRVRRCLEEYYREDGTNSPLRIVIKPGSYVPTFQSNDDSHQKTVPSFETRTSLDWRQLVVGGAAGALGTFAIMTGVLWDQRKDDSGNSATNRSLAERTAIFSKSATSLQAVNLANQARGLIFPAFDADRQRLTSQLFLRAVDLDPKYHGGYAGASQSLASLALILPPGEEKELTMVKASFLVKQAIDLAPAHAWTQSAVGWTAMAQGNYELALEASRRAYEIDPKEGNVLDFYAGVALFAGEFREAAQVSDPLRLRKADNQRLAHRNIHGAALYHLGEYEGSLKSFREAAALGEPLSIASLAYQAAALHALNRNVEGERISERMMVEWPSANLAAVFEAYYKNPEDAGDIIDRLTDLGWKVP